MKVEVGLIYLVVEGLKAVRYDGGIMFLWVMYGMVRLDNVFVFFIANNQILEMNS